MNLSSSRAQMCKHEFVVEAIASELVEALGPAYGAWVTESKRDDELSGGPQDELALAGYPPLGQLLQGEPVLLDLVIGSYLLHEFLGKFTGDGTNTIEYWFDRTTGCRVAGETVFLTGACYSR